MTSPLVVFGLHTAGVGCLLGYAWRQHTLCRTGYALMGASLLSELSIRLGELLF